MPFHARTRNGMRKDRFDGRGRRSTLRREWDRAPEQDQAVESEQDRDQAVELERDQDRAVELERDQDRAAELERDQGRAVELDRDPESEKDLLWEFPFRVCRQASRLRS